MGSLLDRPRSGQAATRGVAVNPAIPTNVTERDYRENTKTERSFAGYREYYAYSPANLSCSIHPDMRASVTVEGSGEEPPPPPTADSCVSQQVLDAFLAHVKSAHLERSPFQQVNDILAADQYLLTHTVWLETVLAPAAEQLTC